MGKKVQVISRELLYIIAAPTAANGLGWIQNLVVSCFVRLCNRPCHVLWSSASREASSIGSLRWQAINRTNGCH